jgi:hypothetical protein
MELGRDDFGNNSPRKRIPEDSLAATLQQLNAHNLPPRSAVFRTFVAGRKFLAFARV